MFLCLVVYVINLFINLCIVNVAQNQYGWLLNSQMGNDWNIVCDLITLNETVSLRCLRCVNVVPILIYKSNRCGSNHLIAFL